MRVVFLHQPWSIVRPGAVESDSVVLWTDHVARRLVARGHRVVCYSRLGDGLPATQVHEDGVEHRRVSGALDRYVKFAFRKFDQLGLRDPHKPLFASPMTYRYFIRQVVRDLRARGDDVDVVHVHNTSQFVPVLRGALPERTKVALHMHCEWLTQLDRRIVGPRVRACDLVIGVSEYLADKTRARFPECAERIRRVYNGADVERFDVAPTRVNRAARKVKRLLYVGRISPEKGIHTLLDAFAIVARQRDDVHLRVIGSEQIVWWEAIVPFCDDPRVLQLGPWFRGGYMDHLRSQLATLPPDRLEFFGRHVPHPELPQHYSEADVFVFPSVWEEPFGMPLVEAMAAGLPCVATRGGAFPEIVQDGRTGLLVERGDAQQLADAVLRLCENDSLRISMGQAARSRAREKFSWDHVADSLVEEYGRAGAGTNGRDRARHESVAEAVS
jgi:glycosyltransferase involved in cell wall biosynthesis